MIESVVKESHITLNIKDSGVGIPESLLDKIFDPTEKTTRKGTSGEKGTGFGLPIVKESVELFNGIITVRSSTLDHDHGTIFSLRFPLNREAI